MNSGRAPRNRICVHHQTGKPMVIILAENGQPATLCAYSPPRLPFCGLVPTRTHCENMVSDLCDGVPLNLGTLPTT